MNNLDISSNQEYAYFFRTHLQSLSRETQRQYDIMFRKLFRYIEACSGESPEDVSFLEFEHHYNANGEFIGHAPISKQFLKDFLDAQNTNIDTAKFLHAFFRILCSKGGPLAGIPNPAEGLRVKQSHKKQVVVSSKDYITFRASRQGWGSARIPHRPTENANVHGLKEWTSYCSRVKGFKLGKSHAQGSTI